jgi:hypothetical protein
VKSGRVAGLEIHDFHSVDDNLSLARSRNNKCKTASISRAFVYRMYPRESRYRMHSNGRPHFALLAAFFFGVTHNISQRVLI